MMKKIKIFLFFILLFPKISFALSVSDLMFKSAITLEHQTSHIEKKNFKRHNLENDLKNFENIALGLHIRPIKYLGFNANFSRFSAKSTDFTDQNPSIKSSSKITMIDASALIFIPLVGDGLLDLFLEAGISDINNNLKIQKISDNEFFKSHETAFLYGAGLQIDPYILDIAFRASYQERRANLSILKSNIKTFRVGIVKYF
ncbi:hypothetical protein N8772_02800 [Rickettsiales bacterium]|nr:hypothetical protein [Rickettsiales bacterium]